MVCLGGFAVLCYEEDENYSAGLAASDIKDIRELRSRKHLSSLLVQMAECATAKPASHLPSQSAASEVALTSPSRFHSSSFLLPPYSIEYI